MGHGIKNTNEHNAITARVSRITIAANTALAAMKAAAGILGHSGAMLADAAHTFSDLFGSLAVLIGVYISENIRSRNKELLQRRIEGGISVFLSLLLFYLAFEIGAGGIAEIVSGEYKSAEVPTMLPLAVAVISIVTKEALYRYSIRNAAKADSVVLRALAWHNRTDALVTVGSLIGILGSRFGYAVFDPAASIIISILVIKAAFEIFADAVRALRNSR